MWGPLEIPPFFIFGNPTKGLGTKRELARIKSQLAQGDRRLTPVKKKLTPAGRKPTQMGKAERRPTWDSA